MDASRYDIEHMCFTITNLSINNVNYDDIDDQTNLLLCTAEVIRAGVFLRAYNIFVAGMAV